jgi:putative IMPACT (imprinted ancient) family translation regulator
LAVLRGKADIGDTLIVVTRYFGGTKLGTGGLVRAYTEAAQTGLAHTVFEPKIAKQMLGVEAPYSFYDTLKKVIAKYDGHIEDETFTDNVTVIVQLTAALTPSFTAEIKEQSAGRITPILFDD